ncbi:MAG TPA: nitrite reductase small subunit NirD [Actinocrinis sp.]|jgi:NAD(P)H-dependent nitrite reductase small subunit
MSVLTTTLEPTRITQHADPIAPRAAWTPVCRYDHLIPGRGVAALLDDGTQAAVFRTLADELFAVGNHDPFSGACVISRGLTGARASGPTVASPMYKHVFDLRTGACLDGPAGPQDAALPVYPVRCVDGLVYVIDAPAQRGEEQP